MPVPERQRRCTVELLFDEIESPVGNILIAAHADALCAVDFEDCRGRMKALLRASFGEHRARSVRDPNGYSSRIRAYLGGDLGALAPIEVDLRGTPFQKCVWRALRGIPAGDTRSYGELARQMCRPRAARAVGAANGRNPVALVVPCHRVIGAGGALAGYAGGLERKRYFLAHEGALPVA